MKITTVNHKPDHTVELGISLGGCDWEGIAGYDVLSTPEPGTMNDPPQDLELDVWAFTLTTYYGDDGAVQLPAGINIDPMTLDQWDRIEQACIDDWHALHSPRAMADDAADRAYDARKDGAL